ncbi:MAG: DUF202 domain-containing protein [Alphaproteobacteria bacterium]|nr:DUF202 domain-containing protein [Alphaproteobacteria bacterium]
MSEPPPETMDRRTQLAADRTMLAAERTYAAWMRTGLAAMASGVGARSLLKGVIPAWSIRALGTTLILFSAFSFVAAVWREVNPGPPPPWPDLRRLPRWILLAINTVLLIATLAMLAGIWAR